MKNPANGQIEKTKSVSKVIDNNSRSFVMYMKDGDGWAKWMEINYKKKK